MGTLTISPEYEQLLRKVPPRVIRTERENQAYTEVLYELDRRSSKLTAAERELAETLDLADRRHRGEALQASQGKAGGCRAVLKEQHNLLQKDLADVFGTPSVVSEVLNGKRELNKEQIARLSERFHVSPELFF